MNKKFIASLLLPIVVGCGSKSEVLETSTDDPNRVTKKLVTRGSSENVTSRGVVTKVRFKEVADRSELQSHAGQVCMVDGPLPDGLKYREVGQINATKKTYGSPDEVLLAMADEGRRIGVEAITGLQARQRHGIMPWRMSVPSNAGVLVKLDPESLPLDCVKLGGQFY
jgi:hypothetical protein